MTPHSSAATATSGTGDPVGAGAADIVAAASEGYSLHPDALVAASNWTATVGVGKSGAGAPAVAVPQDLDALIQYYRECRAYFEAQERRAARSAAARRGWEMRRQRAYCRKIVERLVQLHTDDCGCVVCCECQPEREARRPAR